MDHTDQPPESQGFFRFNKTISAGNILVFAGMCVAFISWYSQTQSSAATQELRLHFIESLVSNLPKDEQQLTLQQAQISNHEAQITSIRGTESALLEAIGMVRIDLAAMKAQIALKPSGN